MEDPYDLEHVIQKAVDLVSGKTIAQALKHTPTIMSRNNKINPESRGQVSFSKEESVRKIEPNADVESLCHKLHSAISPSILHRFSRSQWLRKALEKTFRSVPVTS